MDLVQDNWLNYDYPFLPNAPIIEGNIYVRFETPLDNEVLLKFKDKLTSYTIHSNLLNLSIKTDTENHESKIEKAGFRLQKADAKDILLLRYSDFLVSNKKPYSGWNNLYDDFTYTLDRLNSLTSNVVISKIGCRYINRFAMDVELSLSKYLNFYPYFKDDFIENVNTYSLQLKSSHKNLSSVINFNTNPISNEQKEFSILFDIEITQDGQINSGDSKTIKNSLYNIRNYKNYIFFNSLSDKILNKFK